MPREIVLVADDEWDIRELVVDTLADMGFEVIQAENGGEALEKATHEHPDLILLDVWMPGMDGFQVLEKLRENSETQSIPVVLLTVLPAAEGEQTAMELGAAHYVTKPWKPGLLEATVRVALREAGEAGLNGNGGTDQADIDEADISHAQIFDAPEWQALVRSGRKKSDESEPAEYVGTANKLVALEQKLGGGIPVGSVTMIEGASTTGKSVLCQHLVYGALADGLGATYFTSEYTPEGLLAQMSAIGLDMARDHRVGRLQITTLPEPTEGENTEPLLATLATGMEHLPQRCKFIVVDSITELAGSSQERAVIGFFSSCKRMATKGKTIIVVAHSYAFDRDMFARLRSLCDGYLLLGTEKVRERSVKTLEVCKVNNTILTNNNMVSFDVEPKLGMKLIPMNRTRA